MALVLRATAPPPPDEVVEDSEPEREQRRREERAKRKNKRRLHDEAAQKHIVNISSDSDVSQAKPICPVRHLRENPHRHTVIEISDSPEDEPAYDWGNLGVPAVGPTINDNATQYGDSVDSTRLPSVREIIALTRHSPSASSPRALGSEEPILLAPTGTSIPNVDMPTREPSPVSIPSGSRILDIARFAYNGSQRTISSRAPSMIPSRATPALEPPNPLKKTRVASMVLQEFSDSDLGKLRKCVSCELAWTTRKTAPQKLKHIQTCAKKLKLTEETLRHLFRAELDRIKRLPPEETQGKGKGKLPEAPPESVQPGTLLEEVIVGGTRKKPGRRPQVVESLKQLHETRQDILDRARQLLGGHAKVSMPLEEDSAGPLEYSPPRTQPFGESRLAQRHVPAAVLDQTQAPMYVPDFEAAGPSHQTRRSPGIISNESPPRTQPFGKSALAKKFGKARALGTDSDDDLSRSPPRPQLFGESSLAKKFGKARGNRVANLFGTEQLDLATPQSPPSPIRRHIFNEVSNSSPPPHYRAAIPSLVSSDSDIEITDGSPLLFIPGHNPAASPSPLKPHSSNGLSPRLPSMRNSLLVSPALSPSRLPAEDRDPNEDLWQDKQVSTDENYNYAHDKYNWADDDNHDEAVIRYEPSNDIPDIPSMSSSEDAPAKTQAPRKTRSTSPTSPARKRSTSPTSPTREEKTKKPKKGKKTKEDEPPAKISDEELHDQLRQRIEQNTSLYHRILRYEPIHFDVFFELASDIDVSSRGLKLRVRDFLDKQAIHFHGLDITTGRTKKRRR